MKKKLALLITASAVTSLAIAAVALSPRALNNAVKGDPSYTMVLDGNTEIVDVDGGILHQANIKNNKIDFVGYSRGGGQMGQIKQTTYGQYTYNGLIYNRSIINGLTSIKVVYGGAQLSYTFTEFLMENMDWYTFQQLDSGVTYNAPAGCGYFVIARPGSNTAGIDRIEITYACQGDLDAQMIYNSSTSLGGARSNAKSFTREDSFIEIENNPLANNNNYSTGSHSGHNDTWYRWCGKYFTKSRDLGTDFTFGMTIIGEYARMVDSSKFFHYNVWPQIGSDGYADDNSYAQIYIGNDNYEPLGKDHALHPTDPYVNESYEGRFFTNYGWYNDDWQFADPDTTLLPGSTTVTYRQAYNAYELPFWFVKFHVYLAPSEDDPTKDVPVYDAYVNGFKVEEECELLDKDHYDSVNKPSLYINTLPMHLVNYGVDAEGTPGESYTGCFTYPRLITA